MSWRLEISIAKSYLEVSIVNRKRISNKNFLRECLQKSSLVITGIKDAEIENLNVTIERSCTSRGIMLTSAGVYQINDLADVYTGTR